MMQTEIILTRGSRESGCTITNVYHWTKLLSLLVLEVCMGLFKTVHQQYFLPHMPIPTIRCIKLSYRLTICSL